MSAFDGVNYVLFLSYFFFFFFKQKTAYEIYQCDWSSDVCSSDLLLLLVASFWSWTIIFEKVMRFRRLREQAENFEESFWSGGSLEELYDRVGKRPDHPMAAIFTAAMTEWRRQIGRVHV